MKEELNNSELNTRFTFKYETLIFNTDTLNLENTCAEEIIIAFDIEDALIKLNNKANLIYVDNTELIIKKDKMLLEEIHNRISSKKESKITEDTNGRETRVRRYTSDGESRRYGVC